MALETNKKEDKTIELKELNHVALREQLATLQEGDENIKEIQNLLSEELINLMGIKNKENNELFHAGYIIRALKERNFNSEEFISLVVQWKKEIKNASTKAGGNTHFVSKSLENFAA